MIMGRNAGLWTALIQAVLNVVVAALIVSTGHPLDASVAGLFAALNALGAVVVGLVSNSSDAAALPTFAPTLVDRRSASSVGSAVSASLAPDQQRRSTDKRG